MKKELLLKTIVATPAQILSAGLVLRFTFFVENMHNSADELTVMFDQGNLYFSDKIDKEEIKKYERLFYEFGTGRYIDGENQTRRYKAIKERFGKDGEKAALEAFKWHKKAGVKHDPA